MRISRPVTLDELFAACADAPGSTLLAGGTDVMVAVNDDGLRPPTLIDLSGVAGLRGWSAEGDGVRIGAGMTFAAIERDLGTHVPALATAARTVGSPQIRNRATIGGNIGTASPAGDALPVLIAADAVVELGSVRGVRNVAARDYFLAPRRTVLEPDECVLAVTLPVTGSSAQQFAKIGVRNAMVISVASFALHLDPATGTVGTGMGSVAPVPLAAPEAERWLATELFDGPGAVRPPGASTVRTFADLVAEAATPIDDIRGTAAYRRQALRTMAARTLSWAVADLDVAA